MFSLSHLYGDIHHPVQEFSEHAKPPKYENMLGLKHNAQSSSQAGARVRECPYILISVFFSLLKIPQI